MRAVIFTARLPPHNFRKIPRTQTCNDAGFWGCGKGERSRLVHALLSSAYPAEEAARGDPAYFILAYFIFELEQKVQRPMNVP